MAAPLALAFDHGADLPRGHHVVEASAGTGKTFALVGLATRFLAEGRCTSDQLLVVTFSRAATRELRGRLLDRLAGSADLLARVAAGGAPPAEPDDVEAALLRCDDDELAARAGRLQVALADIDHATVTTIHGLCDDLLRRLGDHRLGTLAEDDGELAVELRADLVLRMVRHRPDVAERLPFADAALDTVLAGMRTPPEQLVPDRSLDHTMGVRAWMALAAGLDATSRRAAARQHTHDDLLHLLADRLTDPQTGAVVAGLLRQRLVVGLVDEFQDTDPAQWTILRSIFDDPSGGDGRTLVLVGDPKQAIYAFRGADIATYLRARGARPDRTLVENQRADASVVAAVTHLFEPVRMGAGIAVHQVTARHPDRLTPAPPAPVALRVVTDDAPVPTGSRGPRLGAMRDLVAADVAAHVVDLMATPRELALDRGTQALRLGDVSVLVRTNAQAALVQRQLVARGVPTVLNGVGNVLSTAAARDWLALLRAVMQPTDGSRARLAAMTDLVGWTVARTAEADDDDLDDLHVLLHELAEVADGQGLAALLRHVDHATSMSPRLRREAGGERRLADLLHVAEILNVEARRAGIAVAGLVGWLEGAIATAADPPPAHLARRLERSGDAVEIMTVHGAKGLERGIVLAPYLWDTGGARGDVLVYTDPATGERRVDVGGRHSRHAPDGAARARAHREDLAAAQAEDEEMRLAYVAATRARHHLVLWWACAGTGAASSPLSALLARGGVVPTAAEGLAHAAGLATAHPDLFHLTPVADSPHDRRLDLPDPGRPALRRGTFDRPVDHGWGRHSYSRLIARGEEEAVGRGLASGPDDDAPEGTAGSDDDGHGPEVPAVPDDEDAMAESPLAHMPGGAEVGTLVHSVLEEVDFADDDLPGTLGRLLAAHSRGTSVDLTDPRTVDGLVKVLDTPLGPWAGGRALRAVTRADRIDELAFELPALGPQAADAPGSLNLGDLADLMEAHLPEGDPMHGYADVLREHHRDIEVRGYLAGFVDLLLRIPVDAGPDRFVVADYKTNRLAPPGEDVLRVGHHGGPAMAAVMWHHHYPVQALFYLVAAHRYLRWRVPGYDPEANLAGAAYLFIRGMAGPRTPLQADGTPFGVLRWAPPATLLLAVDDLLARGPARTRR